MPIRSHVDLCLYVRFFHVLEKSLPDGARALMDSAEWLKDRTHASGLDAFVRSNISFHETYHFWQGLRLPFLYWYATLSLRVIVNTFAAFHQIFSDIHSWEGAVPVLTRLDQGWWCIFIPQPRALLISRDEKKPTTELDLVAEYLTSYDLLENCASIAEWSMTTEDKPIDCLSFQRWCKRNPAYTKAYDFTSRVLADKELALRCFVSLASVSFETSDPVRTFANLLSLLSVHRHGDLARFIKQEEPCRWPELFRDMMCANIEFEAPELGDLTTERYFRLSLKDVASLSYASPYADADLHPILTSRLREWSKREEREPDYASVIYMPRFVSREVLERCLDDFAPPITIVRIHAGDRSKTFRWFTTAHDPDADGKIRHLMRIYGAVRRAAGVHFDPDARLCHHVKCPEHTFNYCNLHLSVPRHYEECTFSSELNKAVMVMGQNLDSVPLNLVDAVHNVAPVLGRPDQVQVSTNAVFEVRGKPGTTHKSGESMVERGRSFVFDMGEPIPAVEGEASKWMHRLFSSLRAIIRRS